MDDGLASDAVQEAIRGWRVNDAVLDEEDVSAGRFGDLAAMIKHHRIGVALGFGGVLGNGADHVETGSLRGALRRLRIGAAIFGDIEADALQLFGRVEMAAPYAVGPCRNTHHLTAAPGNRTDIGFLETLALQELDGRRVESLDGVGHFEVEDLSGSVQTPLSSVSLNTRPP